jgi:hypothetical protein
MKKVEFFCDCCGKKVAKEDDLEPIEVYSTFRHAQDDPNPYDLVDICKDCKNKIETVIHDKFYELKVISTIV